MSQEDRFPTVVVAILLGMVGFVLGAGGSAWQTREVRAAPWRKMLVEHEGIKGKATRTRVVFENPKLPLQAIEVIRRPDATAELAHAALRDGTELTAHYEKDPRPASIDAPDGSRALLTYKGSNARVTFVSPDGRTLGDKVYSVPIELRPALHLARGDRAAASAGPKLWDKLSHQLEAEALAQQPQQPRQPEDEKVITRRDVEVALDIRVPAATPADSGSAELEASCPPLNCVPASPNAPMPGQSTVRITVTGSAKRAGLSKPNGPSALSAFEKEATDERQEAQRLLPDVATVVAALGVTADACKALKFTGQLCVSELTKGSTSTGGAVHAISSYGFGSESAVISKRAEQLYYEAQARAALDRETPIQLCLSRKGFARACTEVGGRPFAAEPMAAMQRSVELRRGIGGTLEGSFIMSQSDGADCTFSPSPKTTGPLRLSFDNEHNTATASLKASARGTRPNLGCSLGTANMIWSQNYSSTPTQTFAAAQLQSGGKLPLHMVGTMNGSGGYSFSNCRTSGGASADCPGGKNDAYSYHLELTGELDLDTQTGSGRIVVTDAPLATSGMWRIPAFEAQ